MRGNRRAGEQLRGCEVAGELANCSEVVKRLEGWETTGRLRGNRRAGELLGGCEVTGRMENSRTVEGRLEG